METIELDILQPRGVLEHDSDEQAEANQAIVQYPKGLKLVFITVGLVLSIFLAALDSTIIATAIPSITDQFGSISNIAWYGTAYSITNTSFQSCWAKAYNCFDMKRTFLLAIAVFEIGNIICAAAPSSSVLILGRVVAGMGGGGIMTGAFIIIALTAQPEYRAAYMGVLGVTFGCASVVGPLMGGALTDGPGWRWCFWVSLPIGGLAAVTMLFFFHPPDTPKEESLKEKIVHTDIGGGILITGALSCFVLAMHWGGFQPWRSASVILSLTGFAGFTALFCLNEWKMGARAMIQGHLLKKRAILTNLGYIFFLAGVYFPLNYSLPIQFQAINNNSASQSGVRLIPLVLGISVFTMVSNVLLTFWRHYNPFLLLGAMAATAGVSMIYAQDMSASTGTWIGYEVLAAAGIGLALQIPMIANQAVVPADDIAAATSLSLFMENLGTSLWVASSEAAFTNGLMSSLMRNAPSIDPAAVVNAGATQIRSAFGGDHLEQILSSYLDGCKISHLVGIVCGATACLISLSGAAPAGIRELKSKIIKPHQP